MSSTFDASSSVKKNIEWDTIEDLGALKVKVNEGKESEDELSAAGPETPDFDVKTYLQGVFGKLTTREATLNSLRTQIQKIEAWNESSYKIKQLFELRCELRTKEKELSDVAINEELNILKNGLKLECQRLVNAQRKENHAEKISSESRRLNLEANIESIRQFQRDHSLPLKYKALDSAGAALSGVGNLASQAANQASLIAYRVKPTAENVLSSVGGLASGAGAAAVSGASWTYGECSRAISSTWAEFWEKRED